MRAGLLLLAALCLLQAPWLARPVHYDEANFLTLARGAAADPWRPHDVRINWQGTEERAFDVLSNPPGIAWWLAPVRKLSALAQRLWMLCWLPLMVWGALGLSRQLGRGLPGAALLLVSPIVFLSIPALLPDAPLYALTLAGFAGFLSRSESHRVAWPFALMLGCAALFRYSAVVLPLVLGLWLWSRGRSPLGALWGWVPVGLLALHDLHAYGEVHLLAMGSFQAVSTSAADLGHKAAASLAMLGGAAALPLMGWGRAQLVGAGLGGLAGAAWGPLGALFAALGGAALLTRLWPPRGEDKASFSELWLGAWAFGGALFLLTLRFSATRYWLPFLPPILLAFPPGRRPWLAPGLHLALGLALAADELQSARAQEKLADTVAALGVGGFTGHWGWQWAMEERGWRALDEGTTVPTGALVAIPTEAWPQPVIARCERVLWSGGWSSSLGWMPRGYSREGEANLHANWISGDPPTRTILPWTFASDPYEQVKVCAE